MLRGPSQRLMYSGFVQASNTSARGASNVRRVTMVGLSGAAMTSSFRDVAMGLLLFLLFRGWLALQLLQDVVEARVALLPVLAVRRDPVGDQLEAARLEAAGAALGVAAARDEAGPLEHLEVLRDRRLAHVVRFGQLEHGRLTARQLGHHRASRAIGERGEGRVQVVGGEAGGRRGRHGLYITIWLDNRQVIYRRGSRNALG